MRITILNRDFPIERLVGRAAPQILAHGLEYEKAPPRSPQAGLSAYKPTALSRQTQLDRKVIISLPHPAAGLPQSPPCWAVVGGVQIGSLMRFSRHPTYRRCQIANDQNRPKAAVRGSIAPMSGLKDLPGRRPGGNVVYAGVRQRSYESELLAHHCPYSRNKRSASSLRSRKPVSRFSSRTF